MEELAGPCCETCRFYLRDVDKEGYAGTGDCRRFPPSVLAYKRGNPETQFPSVDAFMWCGEHKPHKPLPVTPPPPVVPVLEMRLRKVFTVGVAKTVRRILWDTYGITGDESGDPQIRHLLRVTQRDLWEAKGIGPTLLGRIKAFLKEHGLDLAT